MKSIKPLFFVVLFLCLLLATTSLAHDIDLYTASGAGIEPNLLIIFDSSGSMNDEVKAYYYNNSTTYSALVVPLANRDVVYYRNSWGGWTTFKDNISQVSCAVARTALTNRGHYEGNTNSSCSSQYRTLRTGNYRNYLASVNYDEYKPKIDITKDVIKDFLNTVNGVRVGVMRYNNNEGGYLQSGIATLTDVARTQLKSDINAITANGWTPLAETLYEAGLYFKGGSSYFNSGVTYASPMQYYCQKNYVIIITDGISTQDRNSVLGSGSLPNYPKIGDQDGDGREPGGTHEIYYDSNGSDYLDDVAKYLYDTDLRNDLETQQNIVTYTIGFELDTSDPAMAPKAKDLLQRTATHGHGKFYTTSGSQSLAEAFQNIIGEILSKSTSFVAPIVPVSRMERTTAGDKIYLALFKPEANGMWYGNIKKFGVAQKDDSSKGIKTGDILDVDGAKALDSRGQFFSTAESYWSADADGGEVQKGGVGEVLMNRTTARNIYTYMGTTNTLLTHSENALTTGNSLITPTTLALLADDYTGKDNLIKYVHGYDAYDDNNNGYTDDKRDWFLGSFLHSRPFIVHYGTTRSVFYAGSNDGMLHAFDDSDGRELWGFVPPNLLNKLQALHADVLDFFVDGSPRVYLNYDVDGNLIQGILIFGERRGGNHYYALDITDPDQPKYLWEINPDVSGYAELGQTWSSPIIGKIEDGTPEGKWVVFIGGGYDNDNQDNDNPSATDSKGRAIYVVDVLTGSLIWRYSYAENDAMSHSIPSDIAKVDTDGNGKIDRLYVGDMGGQMWRFDIGDPNPTQWTAKILFKSNLLSSDRRKIFCPPDVTLELDTMDGTKYEMLFFGTGDREAPKESVVLNRIYAVKDKNPTTPLVETDLVDVTSDLLQLGTPEEKNNVQNQLASKSGWLIQLDVGEKSLATPVIFFKVSYFTTFTPSCEGQAGDPCYVGEGIAKLYALGYSNGNAIFNFDFTNDMGETSVISKSDRSTTIGVAIPSGVIITFIGGTAVAYTGVGGGVYVPKLASTKSLVPMNWRVAF